MENGLLHTVTGEHFYIPSSLVYPGRIGPKRPENASTGRRSRRKTQHCMYKMTDRPTDSTHMTRRLGVVPGVLLELEEVIPLLWRWNHLRCLGLRPRLLCWRLLILGVAHSEMDRDQIVVLYPYLLIRHKNQIG